MISLFLGCWVYQGIGNIDARLLAALLIDPESLTRDEMDRMVRSATFAPIWIREMAGRQG